MEALSELKIEEVEYVFLDTSIFETNNFLEGKRINELLKLSEDGEIKIVLTRITHNEIISRFRKNLKESKSAFKTFRDKSRVFRNLPSKKPLFDAIDEEDSVKEFTKLLEDKLQQAKCLILDYPVVNIKEIFDKYFAKDPPFGEGQKKDEFPDAFALLTIEKWCEQHNRKCHILSTDGDMITYQSPHLIIEPKYEDFLDMKLRTKAIVDISLDYLAQHESQVETILLSWLTDNLNDERRYIDVINYMEVHDIDIKNLEVFLAQSKVVSVDSDTVEVEMIVEVDLRIDVEIPDEETVYRDDDDHEYYYLDRKTVRIERTEIFPVLITVGVSVEADKVEAYEFNITQINEGKDLELSNERQLHYK
jgi:predicted nucleic acid-binding protein